jgi:hypothetical protein
MEIVQNSPFRSAKRKVVRSGTFLPNIALLEGGGGISPKFSINCAFLVEFGAQHHDTKFGTLLRCVDEIQRRLYELLFLWHPRMTRIEYSQSALTMTSVGRELHTRRRYSPIEVSGKIWISWTVWGNFLIPNPVARINRYESPTKLDVYTCHLDIVEGHFRVAHEFCVTGTPEIMSSRSRSSTIYVH